MGSNGKPAPHHETPTLGNPDLPPEGMGTTTGEPASAKMPGPRNPVLESQFPNVITAPVPARHAGNRAAAIAVGAGTDSGSC
jgi:oxalate decarboxylase